jgi:fibronectin type 3 domain-containing protein
LFIRKHIGHFILGVLIILILSCGLEEEKSSGGGASAGTPPPAPTEVTATVGNKQVVVQWKEAVGALSYNLYWSNSPGVSPTTGTKMASVLSPCMHTGLGSGLTYYYVVTAVNAYGESGKSAEVSVIMNSPPSTPAGIVATGGEGQVVLNWDPVQNAASYNLYWSLTRGAAQTAGSKIANVSPPYAHRGLDTGATYYYVLTAVNAYGESGYSPEAAVTLDRLPSAPTGLSLTTADRQVILSWNRVDGAASYNLYWSLNPGVQAGGGQRIANVTSPYSHNGLSNGAAYYYAVSAVNADGESILSEEVWGIPRGDLNSARMRVVWIQDLGDGSNFDDQGSNLRLMGLDSDDGRGERVILGTPKNYSKPLITPRGNRVVFSDRIQKKVNIVNWDGSGLREVLSGFGLALWKDPRDGQEWIYYGSEVMREGGNHCPAVYRTRLDNPGAGELVWNRTPVSVDSFQVSADGLLAGGNFPWPVAGIAELPNGPLKTLGSGCWTALTQDNSATFWVFDSAHRNLFVDHVSGLYGRWININGAPGINGYEVYHPRWSNHPRIMAMTGPYKVGSGANRIAGGGREVEIYVGRFDADYRVVEFWWQVTSNDRGDFFPDVWVSP